MGVFGGLIFGNAENGGFLHHDEIVYIINSESAMSHSLLVRNAEVVEQALIDVLSHAAGLQ